MSEQELLLNDADLVKVATEVIELLKNGADPDAPPGQQAKGIHPRSIQAQTFAVAEAAPVVDVPVEEPKPSVRSLDPPSIEGESALFWGAASVATLYLAAPLVRPVLRAAVKGGFRLKLYAEETASAAKEELEDLAAEVAVGMAEASK